MFSSRPVANGEGGSGGPGNPQAIQGIVFITVCLIRQWEPTLYYTIEYQWLRKWCSQFVDNGNF